MVTKPVTVLKIEVNCLLAIIAVRSLAKATAHIKAYENSLRARNQERKSIALNCN